MSDDAAVFLLCSAEEARNVNQCHERDIECIAEADESCSLA